MSKVRTRYAPSPTGHFHIGGARTALFNYLYARRYNGEFIVRIEDTDEARNVEGGIQSQLLNLKWLGLFPDESPENPGEVGPYIQSQKYATYRALAEQLLAKNLAYRCFCSPEELEQARLIATERGQTPKYARTCLHLTPDVIEQKLAANIPYVIRLQIPDDMIYEWHDLIRGEMSIPASTMSDLVILKANKIPTYNFAVVIDDHAMQITHVFRGEEHLSNTPYQLAVKTALGYNDDFIYAHFPIIVDETGKKLSKRNLALEQFIDGFRDKGYLPEALVNFLALLGWSDAENKEIISLTSLVRRFDINRISSAPAFFDIRRLNWISGEYFKKMDEQSYLSFVLPFFHPVPRFAGKEKQLALLFKRNLAYAAELNTLVDEHFSSIPDWTKPHQNLAEQLRTFKDVSVLLTTLKQNLEALSADADVAKIKEAVLAVGQTMHVGGKDLFMPIRMALTGTSHGPELAAVIQVCGLRNVLEALEQCVKQLGA